MKFAGPSRICPVIAVSSLLAAGPSCEPTHKALNWRVLIFLLALGVLALQPRETTAAIVYEEEVLTESNAYFQSIPGFDFWETSSTITATGPAVTTSFSAEGLVDVTSTIKAPPGFRINIQAPLGWTNLSVSSSFGSGTVTQGGSGEYQDLSPTFIYTGLQGTLPSAPAGSFSATDLGGDRIQAQDFFSLSAGDSFSFTAVSITSQFPASYNVDFNNPNSTFQVSGTGFTEVAGGPGNPGQWVSLVPVPEPSSVLLLGLGAFGLVGSRGRRRRRHTRG